MKSINHAAKTERLMIIILAFCFTLAIPNSASAYTSKVTFYYGDFPLPQSFFASLPQPGSWNLNECTLTINYELDLADAPNVDYDWNWNNMGIVGLFNVSNLLESGAQMCGFLADWENRANQFPDYPDFDNTQDLDDKFNMQRFPNPGAYDETVYDVYCETNVVVSSFGTSINYGIWFDRDGVDQWQDDMWGMVNGGTYNTQGTYVVELLFRKVSDTKGTACPTLFPDLANSWVTGGYGIPTGFYTDWKPDGPHIYPAGISFDTDETKMGDMVVYVKGSSGPYPGAIIVKNLVVTGCLNLDEGMATGGGWFIPEWDKQVGLNNPGYKATFAFVAKQAKGTSSGQLEFQYHGDGLSLKSTTYDWATVAATQAMFEGVGRLNGMDGYKFRVRAVDGDKIGTGIDRFEIRIWTGADKSFDDPTYRAEGDLGGGQIVVHKK